MSESRGSSPILPDTEDTLDKELDEDEDFDDPEGDDEEHEDGVQDSEPDGVLESDGEMEGEARLLNREEKLHLDGGDDLLDETQLEIQDVRDRDAHMRDVDASDGSDSEPLVAKRPAVEKRGRGRPAGKSMGKSLASGTGASTSTKAPISVDNPLGRQPGKSLFPASRVTKVIKADRDLPMVAKDAVFLISLATEEFIRRLAVASHTVATKENRATVRLSDIVSVSKRIDEFLFLEDILPYCPPEPTKAKGNKSKAVEEQPVKSGPMNQFIAGPKQVQRADEDVVMQDEM